MKLLLFHVKFEFILNSVGEGSGRSIDLISSASNCTYTYSVFAHSTPSKKHTESV